LRSVKTFDGEYLGTYHAYPGAGYESGPAAIGLCRSRDLRNWRVEEPILFAGDGASRENSGLYKLCLVEEDGTFFLFYNAKNAAADWREQTGFATSTDLENWTRHTEILS
jgi:beta-xylosidase